METLKQLHRDRIDISNYSLKEQNTLEGKTLVMYLEIKIKRKDYERKTLDLMSKMDDVDIEAIE